MPRPIGGSVHRRPTTCTDNLVGVMDDRGGASLSHRHVQRVEDQFGAQMVGHRPPHHPAAEHIEYDGQVQESRRGRDVGDVGHPQSVRGLGHEATLDQVRRGAGLGVTTRGARPLATAHPGQACLTHLSTFGRQENRHSRATRLRLTGVCPQRSAPRESGALRTSFTAAFVNRSHARAQRHVRCFARRALTGAPRVVPARGDSEDRASSRSERNFGGPSWRFETRPDSLS